MEQAIAMPVAPRRRLRPRRGHDPQELVVAVIKEHAESLLRVARRYTDSAADAEDAYQRAMEIFVRSAHRLDPLTAHRWLHTVLKHECFAVREARNKLVGVEDETELDVLDDGRCVTSVEERAERFDDLAHAAEALKRLKPAEVTALVLKAQGLSYKEIAERQNWTYTKVNRALTEGRRAFLARFEGIQSGAECERWTGVLSAMADGEARAQDVLAVRPHLRNCAACRATLAAMDRAPAAAAAVVPVVGAGGGLLARIGEWLSGLAEPVAKVQSSLEAAGAAKVAAVAASAAAIAGGGVAVHREVVAPPQAPASPPAKTASAPAKTTSSPAPLEHRVAVAAPAETSAPPREETSPGAASEEARSAPAAETDPFGIEEEPRTSPPAETSPFGAAATREDGGAATSTTSSAGGAVAKTSPPRKTAPEASGGSPEFGFE